MRSAVSCPPLPWPSRIWSYRERGTGQAPNRLAGFVAEDSSMSDHVLLSADHVDQVPQDVQQRLVGFLNAMDAEARDSEAPIAERGHAAAIPARKADRDHAHLTGSLQRAIDIGRLAARRDAQGDVARPPEQ